MSHQNLIMVALAEPQPADHQQDRGSGEHGVADRLSDEWGR